jgi:hypothetical protein
MHRRRILSGWRSLAVILLFTIDSSVLAAPSTTQAIMTGRDTPAGAMNIFNQAIENRDLPTAADSYNLPAASGYMRAAEQIADARLYRALEARFGTTAIRGILGDAGIPITSRLRKYSTDDWIYPPNKPDLALGKSPHDRSTPVPTMQRGSDGIWRMGSIPAPRQLPLGLVAAMEAKALELTAKYDPVVAGIQAGKYASADDVVNVLCPPNSPQGQERAMQKQTERQEKKQQEEVDQQFLTMQFDASTLDGAAGVYLQSVMKKDLAGMVRFYYVEKATDDEFAQAYAKRILGAAALARALADHVPGSGKDDLVKDFGLMPDLPKGIVLSEQGDRGIGSVRGPDQKAIWFRKVEGVWKQDITPQAPMTSADAAKATKEDNAAVDQMIADVVAGKYTSIPQVRDALGNAMLNAWPDSMFVQGGMRVSEEPLPAMPKNPTAVGPPSMNRDSPAGAMNVLVQAIRTSNTATVADSLYMPEDKDGSCRQAAARDLIAGYRFLLAAETRFGAGGAQPISYWCGSIQPWVLDPYTDGDWLMTDDYPDLALLNSLSGSNGNYAYRSGLMVHRGPDGLWRLGPRFPKNARQIRALAPALAAKTARMERTADEIKAGKYGTPGEVINPVAPNPADEDATKLW